MIRNSGSVKLYRTFASGLAFSVPPRLSAFQRVTGNSEVREMPTSHSAGCNDMTSPVQGYASIWRR